MARLYVKVFAIFNSQGMVLDENSRPLMFLRKENALSFLDSQEMRSLCNRIGMAQHDLTAKEVKVNVKFV